MLHQVVTTCVLLGSAVCKLKQRLLLTHVVIVKPLADPPLMLVGLLTVGKLLAGQFKTVI